MVLTMAGLKLKLPTSFTDLTLPLLKNDPILSAGSLLLVDATHPLQPWGAGVPDTNTWLPNIATDEASQLLGSAALADIGVKMNIGGNWIEGSGAGQSGISERTAKGGLHTITSRLRSPAGGLNMKRFLGGAKFAPYLAANSTHDFYVSLWKKHTRAEAPFGPIYPTFARFAALTGGGVMANMMAGGSQPSTGAQWINAANNGANTGVNNATKVGVYAINNSGTSAVVPDPTATWMMGPFWGDERDYSASASPYPWNSMVAYRWYIEDLTVSGRTYAQVAALDDAEHTKQVLTLGGRYFGDTNTDPATIP
jgi:hypothetical protein